MTTRPIVVVSNRGPVSFHRDDEGNLAARRGAGGLVSGIAPLMRGADRLWIAAAMSDADRSAVIQSPIDQSADVQSRSITIDDVQSMLLAIDATDLNASYEVVCNQTLWYLHHHLFDGGRAPTFDQKWFRAWSAYRRVNEQFAQFIASHAPQEAVVLVQDYHLALVGPTLRSLRDDLKTAHFSHTPFADPHVFSYLPQDVQTELLTGMSGHDACGFHTLRWRDAFVACCHNVGIAQPHTFVAPLGPDEADLNGTLQSPAFRSEANELSRQVGPQIVIGRADRIEPSKNLIRGFLAFDTLLDTHPQWREKVTFVASVYPSRASNPDYGAYRNELEHVVTQLNTRWRTAAWTPILLDTSDNYPRSMATLARADVVLVNPVRDGLNLVAKEAMVVNERSGLLALSDTAGAWDELGDVATRVDPFDICQTAHALHSLLSINPDERQAKSAQLRARALARTPEGWLADQVRAVV